MTRVGAALAASLIFWACAGNEELPTTGAGGFASASGGHHFASGGALGAGGSVLSHGGAVAIPSAGGTTSTTTTPAQAGSPLSAGGASAGASAIPPDVLERAQVVLYYQPETTAALTERIFMRLFIENKSSRPLSMSEVTVRYWMTSEAGTPTLAHYYEGANLTGQAVRYIDAGERSYVEFSFTGSTIAAGADLARNEFQLQVTGGTFDQSNDYSFSPEFAGARAPYDRITVYSADRLIWGCDPDGDCADPGTDPGAGGAGGGPGTGGASSGGGAGGAAGATSDDGGVAGVGGETAGAGAPTLPH